MKPLTLYVMDEALRAGARVAGRRASTCRLGQRRHAQPDRRRLPGRRRSGARRWRVDPARLELEITESTMLDDPFRTKVVLDRLNALGVRLSIDDFGTGYSSLAYLRQLPVSEIKIDRSFVLAMDASRGRRGDRPLDDRPRPQPRPAGRRRGRRDGGGAGSSSPISAATSRRATSSRGRFRRTSSPPGCATGCRSACASEGSSRADDGTRTHGLRQLTARAYHDRRRPRPN